MVMNNELDVEGSFLGIISISILAFSWRDLEKPQNFSAKDLSS
jgi:hypothetical protein